MAKGSEKKGGRSDSPLTIVDEDRFAYARCECGWRGPARRSRKRAREDAAAHLDQRCKAFRRS